MDSQELAASLAAPSVQLEHLVMALLDDPTSAAGLLVSMAQTPADGIRGALEERLTDAFPSEDSHSRPAFSADVKKAVEEGAILAGEGPVGTEHLLLAALGSGTSLGLSLRELPGLDISGLELQAASLSDHELLARQGVPGTSSNVPGASAPTSQSIPASPATSPSTGDRRSIQPQPDIQSPGGEAQSVPTLSKDAVSAASTSHSADDSRAHTMMALARLVVDLSGKAASVARAHGSPAVAEQLDRMRAEVESQIKVSKPPSQWGAKSPVVDRGSA